MPNNLAIGLDDGVDVEERVVEGAPEVKPLPVEGLKLLRHQIPHRSNRGPDSLSAVDRHVMAKSLNAISSQHSQSEQSENSCKQKILYIKVKEIILPNST